MSNRYVLITSARNEEDYIEETINSVISQTILPIQWIIVNDHSSDKTEEIVMKYMNNHSFITLLSLEGDLQRNFASKVLAITKAYDQIKNLSFEFIGILDADITFQNNYYESIMTEFDKDHKLGIAGGGFFDIYDNKKIKIPFSPYMVRGAVQLFRRECYENIGGFLPLQWGGEDTIACATARMNGWKINTFEELSVLHHRKTGSVGENLVQINIHLGKRDYHRGLIPLAQLSKSLSRIKEKPFLLGSFLQIWGYWTSKLKGEKLILDENLIEFIKEEQKKRIKDYLGIN